MIKFVFLGDQLVEGGKQFCFGFCTKTSEYVIDFLTKHAENVTIFNSWDHFYDVYGKCSMEYWYKNDFSIDDYKSLMPPELLPKEMPKCDRCGKLIDPSVNKVKLCEECDETLEGEERKEKLCVEENKTYEDHSEIFYRMAKIEEELHDIKLELNRTIDKTKTRPSEEILKMSFDDYKYQQFTENEISKEKTYMGFPATQLIKSTLKYLDKQAGFDSD